MKSNNFIAYALDFTSFLIQKIQDKEAIRNIILFGSASREEANEKSDIDLFIDVVKNKPAQENEIKSIISDFFSSIRYKNYWQPLGIKNDITVMAGEIDKWGELKPSILANGIVLYGKYKKAIKDGEHKAFFIWENIKPNSKRVLFNKQMLGYKQNKTFYQGLLQKYNGEKLGKGCIAAPIEHFNIFHKLFKKYRIAVKIKQVMEY